MTTARRVDPIKVVRVTYSIGRAENILRERALFVTSILSADVSNDKRSTSTIEQGFRALHTIAAYIVKFHNVENAHVRTTNDGTLGLYINERNEAYLYGDPVRLERCLIRAESIPDEFVVVNNRIATDENRTDRLTRRVRSILAVLLTIERNASHIDERSGFSRDRGLNELFAIANSDNDSVESKISNLCSDVASFNARHPSRNTTQR